MNTSMAVVVVFLAALVGVARPALRRPTPVASTPRAALSMMASPVRTDVPLEGSAKELPSTKTTGSYQLTGDKLYTKKEIPPALGGIRLGFRKRPPYNNGAPARDFLAFYSRLGPSFRHRLWGASISPG